MRCFISIDVDQSLAENILKIQEMIGKLQVDVKFVKPINAHFTINFLGNLSGKEISEIKESLKFIQNLHEFKITISRLSFYGNKNQIKTLWLGLSEGETEFTNLMKIVNESVKFGEKNILPHLTIGRVKNAINNKNLAKFMNEFKNVNVGEMTVNVVKLKSSNLTVNGPIYNDLSVFKLHT